MSENPRPDGRSSTDAPRSGVDVPRSGVDVPRTGVDGPRSDVDGPHFHVDGPHFHVDGPDSDVDGPDSSVDGPDSSVDGPPIPLDFPDDPAVAVVLHQVPEFEGAYLDLVDAFDDAPGGPAVFTELADFVASRLSALEADRPILERAIGAIELVADDQDSESTELVGYAFLDSLSPIDRDRIRPWLGPRTRAILDELDGGSPFGCLLGDESESPD